MQEVCNRTYDKKCNISLLEAKLNDNNFDMIVFGDKMETAYSDH